jgi:hypothetical protein
MIPMDPTKTDAFVLTAAFLLLHQQVPPAANHPDVSSNGSRPTGFAR